jgi:hypothetical protein
MKSAACPQKRIIHGIEPTKILVHCNAIALKTAAKRNELRNGLADLLRLNI